MTADGGRVIDAAEMPVDQIVEEVARVVFAGGVVIFPSDTSYGIGCDPFCFQAIDRIYMAKGRPDFRPMTMHVASPQEFLEYAPENPLAILAAKRLLPAPVILLVRKPAFISDELAAGLQTLAFRVPDDPLARAILERCGPLAGTTAGKPPFPPADLIVQHGPPRYDRESSIVDISGPHPRLLREGAVSEQRLSELLGPVERPAVKVRTQNT
jgi:L-threonylcarbamoyladenylate synthase